MIWKSRSVDDDEKFWMPRQSIDFKLWKLKFQVQSSGRMLNPTGTNKRNWNFILFPVLFHLNVYLFFINLLEIDSITVKLSTSLVDPSNYLSFSTYTVYIYI